MPNSMPLWAADADADNTTVQEDTVAPVARELKARQPNWRPDIVRSFSDGLPETILFYQPSSEGKELPAKQVDFLNNSQIIGDTDLTALSEDDPIAKELGKTVVPHGVSVAYYPSGVLKKLAYYDRGRLHGPIKTFFPNGQEETVVVVNQGKQQGKMITYFESGAKEEESFYKNGQLQGDLIRYSAKGTRTFLMPYEQGVVDGAAYEWYESGALKSTKRFAKGVLQGDLHNPAMIAYYEDHTVQELQDFRFGQPAGMHYKYHPSGKESYRVLYENGKQQGTEQFFGEDGAVVGQGEYWDGVPVGEHTMKYANGALERVAKYDAKGALKEPVVEYYENGNKRAEYFRIDDHYEGAYREWYSNGASKCEYEYKNGVLNGEQREYYESESKGVESPALQLRCHFVQGIRHGLHEEWFLDGKPAAHMNMANGKKEGVSTLWYSSGQKKQEGAFSPQGFEGPQTEWYENGNMRSYIECLNGKKEGWEREWNEAGVLVSEVQNVNDLPDGLVKTWYDNGQLKQQCAYNQGKRSGLEFSLYSDGQKQSEAIYKNDSLDGDLTAWHENGQVRIVQHFANGSPRGEHFEYYPSASPSELQQICRQLTYNANGKLEGPQKTFFENGRIEVLITYENGVLNGVKSLWNDMGVLLEEARYSKGVLEGQFFQRTPQGQEVVYHYHNNRREGLHQVFYPHEEEGERVKALEANYVDDLPEGELSEFSEDGSKVASTFYQHGLKEGVSSLYAPDGKLVMTVRFKKDIRDGIAVQYYPNSKIARQVMFVNGLKEGDEKSYHENGEPASVVSYKNDKQHGLSLEWNERGILVFEGEFQEGIRHGKFNKYDDNGKPVLLQTFYEDRLNGVKKSFRNGQITEQNYKMGILSPQVG